MQNRYFQQSQRLFSILLILLLLGLGCTRDQGREPTTEKEGPPITPVLNREYFPIAQELIKEAKEYIHILFLEIHKDGVTISLMEELISARKGGVEIKVLLENKLSCNRESLFYLKRHGIEAKFDSPKKLLHHKLIIVDGRKVLLGSTNWSYMSLDYNNETNVLIRNPTVTHYYEEHFQLLWKDATQEPKIPLIKTKKVIPLAVKKDYFNQLHNLLSNAQKRIHIVMYGARYYPQYPDSRVNTILNDLIEARKRGVGVNLLLEKSDYNERLNSGNEAVARYLKKNGVEVRFDSLETITHAKLIIIDEATLLGSSNWGYGGLELYLGSNVLLFDPQITDHYEKYFQRLWAQSGEE